MIHRVLAGWLTFFLLPVAALAAGGTCANPALQVQFRLPSANTTVSIGQAVQIQVQVVDSCGNLIGTGGAVNATFSNKDPDLKLTNIGNGIWTGTWKPVNSPNTSVTMFVTAFNSNGAVIQEGQASISVKLAGSSTPVVTAAGIANLASLVPGLPIAPGSLIRITGSNLADSTASAVPPYPSQLNGVQILLGLTPVPLLYVSPGQINAQVPYEVPINTQFQITFQRNNLQSLPETLVIAAAQPGIFTVNQLGTGQGVIYHSDGTTLAQSSSPAAVGETVTIQCTGLGAVTPAVADGAPPPTSPLSVTVNPVTATIGGLDAKVSFSGLAPGQPGVYQVNVVVPAGVGGDAVQVVITAAGQVSPMVTMAVASGSAIGSSTTLTSSVNPSIYGQNVTISATVLPSTATGSVTFKDGPTTLGVANLSGGVATLTLSALTAGAHSLTAVYTGDVNDSPGISAPLNQTVNQATTRPTLDSLANPSVSGQSITLTATLSAAATGSITFLDGATTLGVQQLDGGAVNLTVPLQRGIHILTAVYSGDVNYTASTSAALTQTVNQISAVSPCTPVFSYTIGQATPAPLFCEFAAIANASFTLSSTASWFQVIPVIGLLSPSPTPFLITVNPSGLSTGPYSGSFTISGPQLGSFTVPVTLTVVTAQAPSLVATPLTLSFSYQQGTVAPPPQTLTVSSTNGTQLPFSVTSSGGNWLIAGTSGSTCPSQLNVFVSPIGLAPGTYSGTLTIISQGAPPVMVNVSLKVDPSMTDPQLSVSSSPISLSGLHGGTAASAQILVSNSGGGVLNFTATSSGDWLAVSPSSGTVDNTQSNGTFSLTVTADPSQLAPGTYSGSVSIAGAGNSVTIPATFSVAAPKPIILISQTGLSFTAVAQGGAPLSQQVGILNTGNGTLDWSAAVSTLSGGRWLQLSSPAGSVQRPYLDVSLASVTVDPKVVANLDPGDYYGQIRITDSGGFAANSPQLITVILTVLEAGSDPGPEVTPASLIFTGLAGTAPDPQSVMIGIRKAEGDAFKSGHTLGLFPFTYTPEVSTIQPNQPLNFHVTPDFNQLKPGDIERDTITVQFNDGTARNISLLSVAAPASTANSKLGARATNNCTDPKLNLPWRSPSSTPTPYFSVLQGRNQTLELQVVDDCANLIQPIDPNNLPRVTATFSNKDPDLSLTHIGNGVWSGTWKPANPSLGPVKVQVTAFSSTSAVSQSGQSLVLYATILPSNTPLVTAGAVQHAASFVLGAPIAPGSLITLKGLNLGDTDTGTPAGSLPLPTTLDGAQVFLGTEPMPLIYAASGQVNVQVPYDAQVNTHFPVTVQRDDVKSSLPEQLVIAAAQPGIFTVDASGTGPGIIFRADGTTLAQPVSCGAQGFPCAPAKAGETITIQCTGLGAVTPEVPAGTSPPMSPVSTTVNPVSVMIGGVDAQASAGTLIPLRPGVYQVTATVPAGVSGDAVPVVVTVAGQASRDGVTMAVQ